MMNFQQSKGDYSPNICGDNNSTNHNINNIKVDFAVKARYTFIGFLLGVATSYFASYLYDNYKITIMSEKNKTEDPVSEQVMQTNGIQPHDNQ